MKYISVCSGIEAATVAWRPLGWEAVAFAEIEPFPNAVLAHHYPGIPNLGDITKVDWRKYAGMVDLVVGGTPCQSFSVAGKREGLDGASGLVREYFRLLQEVRPRWFVWENVPGALSSNGGKDFAFILRQWEQCGYSVAWRVLDAQFFGVPQRRRRVFAVGHLGGWQYPAAVLFEPESLRGNPAPGRKAGKENSRGIESCAYTAGSFAGYKRGVGTLKASGGDLGGGSETLIAKCLTSSNQRLDWETETLVLNDQGGSRMDISEDVAGTLRSQSKGHEPIVFKSEPGDNHPSAENGSLFAMNSLVRRLTPLECERLQGFPDGYTDIEYKGKPAPDGARYKALGNSMAVPCIRWIGERIQIMESYK